MTFAALADSEKPALTPPPKKLVKVKLRESPSLPLPPPPVSFARAARIDVQFVSSASAPIPSPHLAGSSALLALAAQPEWECARCEGETDSERRTSIAAFDYLGREIQGSALPLCHFCLATIRGCLERKTRLTPVFAPLTPVCKRCKGTGKHGPWGDSDRDADDEEQTCLHCRGTGREIVR